MVGNSLAKMLHLKDQHLFEELTKEADVTRRREEELLKKREADIRARLREEHVRKRARRLEEERLRREEERERLAREMQAKEEARKKAEEERRQWEEQSRRREEERLRVMEAERRQREEEARRQAEERTAKSLLHGEPEGRVQTEAERRQDEERIQAEVDRRQRELEDERVHQEETMRLQREEFKRREEERIRRELEQKKIEAELQRQEEELRQRREEEDRVRREAEEKLRLEEELRRQIEDQQRQETEAKRQEEEAKRQQAEAAVRKEQEQQPTEAGSRENRIQELLANAEAFYADGNYEHALVEVAKALVNNPSNEAAIQLEQKIKEAQGIPEQPDEAKEEAKPQRKRRKQGQLKPRFQRREKRKGILARPLHLIAGVAILAIVVVVTIQLKKKIFPATTTVAILPWVSATNNAEETADGSSLAEEVAKQFQLYKQSSVMGYSSMFALAHNGSDIEQAVYRVGCSHILQGTLTKSALGMSITLKLIDSLGSVRWSEHYDRSLATLPTLPAEIAARLAKALDLPSERPYAPLATTTNGDAYLLYLKGLELVHHRTRSSYRDAFEAFRQSVSLDPSFVQALSAGSLCLSTMAEENWMGSDSALALARDFAEKAVHVNSAMGDGYVALGKVLMLVRDYSNAAEQYTLALKYSPTNSAAHLNRGINYLRLGRYKDAIEAMTRAYELNPRDADILQSLGFAHQLNGDVDQGAWYHQTALNFVQDSVEYLIGPVSDAILLNPELSLTQSARVISACEHRIVQNPEDYATIYRLSRTLQITGKRIEGTTLLDKLEKALRAKLKAEPNNSGAMIYLALTLTRMGKFPEATTWGQRALELQPDDPTICFRLAQMYSLQMYSPARKKVDDKKKDEATKVLKQALRLSYRLDELTNADFYNMYEHGNFRTVIASNPQ